MIKWIGTGRLIIWHVTPLFDTSHRGVVLYVRILLAILHLPPQYQLPNRLSASLKSARTCQKWQLVCLPWIIRSEVETLECVFITQTGVQNLSDVLLHRGTITPSTPCACDDGEERRTTDKMMQDYTCFIPATWQTRFQGDASRDKIAIRCRSCGNLTASIQGRAHCDVSPCHHLHADITVNSQRVTWHEKEAANALGQPQHWVPGE